MEFRNDINGLRAIAVIAVVLFHFNEGWVPGGFAGVDIFFVISGFLMTSIIFRGINNNNFSILKFYLARANRIIPSLAVLSGVLFIFGWFFLTPQNYTVLVKHILSSISFFSNIVYWQESGYFDVASHGKWLLHTWSLSTEWQFYIIYPLVLIVMRKTMSISVMKVIVLAATICSFFFCIIASYKWPTAAYYLLPTRSWEMMFGGVAYLYPFALKINHKKLLERVGLILIVGSYIFISKDNPWPGYLAIFPVLGSFFVIQAQRNDSVITNNIVFQKLGAWSYSIYLWHWPLVAAIYIYSLNQYYIYLGLILSVLLGYLSNKYVEKIKFKNIPNLAFILRSKPLYMVLVISGLSLFVFLNKGENSWFKLQDIATQKTYNIISDNRLQTKDWGADVDGNQNFSECRFNVRNIDTQTKLRLKQCEATFGSGVLILGDSHSIDLFGMVSSSFKNKFLVGITNGGCRVWTKDKLCQYTNVKQFIEKNNSVFNHIIFEQAGFYLLLDGVNKGSRYMFDKLSLSDNVQGIHVDTEHIKITLDYLSELSQTVPTTWFGSRVEPHFTPKQILQKTCNFEFKLRAGQKDVFNSLDQYIEQQITTVKNLKFVSQNKILGYQFPRDFMTCSNTFWSDTDHLSSFGEQTLGARLPKNFLNY